MKDSKVLREHREDLIKEIHLYNHVIGKYKNRLIHINNSLNDYLLSLANYIVEYLCRDSFDVKYTYDKIEMIKRLRVEKSNIERSISYNIFQRDKLYENLKGINDCLCLI